MGRFGISPNALFEIHDDQDRCVILMKQTRTKQLSTVHLESPKPTVVTEIYEYLELVTSYRTSC